MQTLLEYYVVFAFIISVIYFLMMAGWFVSWKLFFTKTVHIRQNHSTIVTIILPVRNEQNNIKLCLDCLADQNYATGQLEIIVSDDFSSDQTVAVCKEYISATPSLKHHIKVIQASDDFASGKKAAIAHAINHSRGELVITTDADCIMGPDWVNSFVAIFEQSRPEMITGFVRINYAHTFFSAMQALEFLSLSVSSAISVIREKPLMCNGANLAFTKTAYLKGGGSQYGSNDASGDDTYLMLKIAGENPAAIIFNSNQSGIVTTQPQSNLRMLITQRIRWASKIKNYKEPYIRQTGIFVFILNCTLISMLVLALTGTVSWSIVVAIWLTKMIADLLILVPACLFASQRNLLLLILPAGLIYPFYSLAGMLLSIGKIGYEWKDRKY